MTFYGLKTCDTCRKALADLAAAGREVKVIDVRADGVPAEVLARLVTAAGTEALVNRRSTTWRGLDEDARARAMEAKTCARVLAQHPTLMKRPVIEADGRVHVGWTAAVRSAVLG